MRYFKNDNMFARYGEQGAFIKLNEKETKVSTGDGNTFGYIVSEGDEITEKEYNSIN